MNRRQCGICVTSSLTKVGSIYFDSECLFFTSRWVKYVLIGGAASRMGHRLGC